MYSELAFAQICGLYFPPPPQKISQLKKKEKKLVFLSVIKGLFVCFVTEDVSWQGWKCLCFMTFFSFL